MIEVDLTTHWQRRGITPISPMPDDISEDRRIYKSPCIRVVETLPCSVMCSSPEAFKTGNEGFEQEEFEW